jgi:hydrogenase nickel incorporation protein HypA/HybF
VHELAVTQNLLETVLLEAKSAKAEKITIISLVIGDLSGVVGDCVQFYFDVLKKGTIAETAVVKFISVPVELKCRGCGFGFKPVSDLWVCPECGDQSVEITGGRDCYIESMEVEP